jgi:REP element-mobilizing transposase RayT
LFTDDADRSQFLELLRQVCIECGWSCIAYCVMTTHVHLVVHTPEPNLGKGMGLLLGRYAFAYNRRRGRRGHLFSDRYWSRRIDRPRYLCCSSLYAVLNPVAARLCDDPEAYVWSSYRETAGLIPSDGLLDPELLLRTLDEVVARARVVYREIVAQAVVRLQQRRSEEAWWKSVERAVAYTGDRLKPATAPGRRL